MLKKHGVNIPVFSLRSYESGGIGEFLDLIPLIKWCKKNGFGVIQLLPINDSGDDPSPYNNLSAFALNPLYIRYKGFQAPDLNGLKTIDYPKVSARKEKFFSEKIYPRFKKTAEFKAFVELNPWLHSYAAFKRSKNRHIQKNDYYFVQQYLAFNQMMEVKSCALEHQVELMGDIPILISKESDIAAAHPEYFHFDMEAGAPPDQYNHEGQKWGFPLYNWDALKSDDYIFWKERLRQAAQFFSSYRIDHIVGFFRIWGVKPGDPPRMGSFYPPQESVWIDHGREILQMMLKASYMTPIGEDLGTIPNGVREMLHTLAIPGTKVIRWERRWHTTREYIPFDEYPELSLTTVSTHDSELLREWWEKCFEEVHNFCNFLGWEPSEKLSASQLEEILRLSHQTKSRYTINLLTEYLSLVPELRYSDPLDDRINRPGTVDDKNWTYRMKPYLEDMTKNTQLEAHLEKILAR